MTSSLLARAACCAAAALSFALASEARTKVPASIGELFAAARHSSAVVSPGGRFAASDHFGRTTANGRIHWHSVRVVDGQTGHIGNAAVSTFEQESILQLLWVDDDSLIVTLGSFATRMDRVIVRARVVDVASNAKGLGLSVSHLPIRGIVVDSLPKNEHELLFSPTRDSRTVYRVDIRDLVTQDDADDWAEVAFLDQDIARWISDSSGHVRAAIGGDTDSGEQRIWYRAGMAEPWKKIHVETDIERFDALIPLAFTPDGKRLLVVSDADRDRYGLYEYDPETQSLGDLVYEHPSAQLIDVVFDYNDEILGVVYLEQGTQQFAYFDDDKADWSSALGRVFPDKVAEVTSLSMDRRKVTARVGGSQDAGGLYYLDLDSQKPLLIGRRLPWLDDNALSETRTFRVPPTSGEVMDAFLTLPPFRVRQPPLVVMPHGGPMGVFDVRAFQPETQYLANAGFAVLRVNYRGSGGYGRAFQRAGHRQWGRGIEDDIEAAVDYAIEQGWVDPNRMCTAGASYGGYSALMLVIRHPGRYRCAASLSGVTDISLLFNSSDWSWDGALRSVMTEVVGDPDADYDEQRAYSPVFNAQKIQVPVHIAHGSHDRRVDVDHAYRMRAMLELHGGSVESLIISSMGHGFSDKMQVVKYYTGLRAFLARHLGAKEQIRSF